MVKNLQRKWCQGPPTILVEPLQRRQNASRLAKKQNGGCFPPSPLLAQSRSLDPPPPFFLFPGMNEDLRGRRFADVAEVQRESLRPVTAFQPMFPAAAAALE